MFKSLYVFIFLFIWSALADSFSCSVFVIYILAFGTLLSIYISENSIIKKHLIARSIFHNSTSLFHIVKSVWLTLLTSIVMAFMLAVIMLISAIYLDFLMLMLLGVDVIVIWFIYEKSKKILASKVKEPFLEAVSRRWSVWINTLLLVLVFTGYKFFSTPLNQVQNIECEILNFLSDSMKYKELLEFKLVSASIGIAEYSKSFIFWILYLLVSHGIFVWVYSSLLLSVDIKSSIVLDAKGKKQNFFLLGFIGTILVLLIATLIINHLYEKHHIQKMQRLMQETYIKIDKTIDKELASGERKILARLDDIVDKQIDTAFIPVYEGIPRLSDYYYSVKGEYTRIALKGHDLYCGYKNDTLAPFYNRYLPNGLKLKRCNVEMLNEEIESKIKKYLFEDTDFNIHIDAASKSINNGIFEDMTEIRFNILNSLIELDSQKYTHTNQQIQNQLDKIDSKFEEVLEASSRDLAKKSLSATGAVLLTSSISKALMSKILLKLGAKSAGKAASFVAGSTTGLTICSPSGPWALLCGVVTGTVSWVGVDAAMSEIDQSFNEDDFQKNISKMIDAEKNTLKALMKESYHKWMLDIFKELKQSSNELKSPYEQLQNKP